MDELEKVTRKQLRRLRYIATSLYESVRDYEIIFNIILITTDIIGG